MQQWWVKNISDFLLQAATVMPPSIGSSENLHKIRIAKLNHYVMIFGPKFSIFAQINLDGKIQLVWHLTFNNNNTFNSNFYFKHVLVNNSHLSARWTTSDAAVEEWKKVQTHTPPGSTLHILILISTCSTALKKDWAALTRPQRVDFLEN